MNINQLLLKPPVYKNDFYKEFINNSFAKADIMINGSRPWDMQLHNDNLYSYLFHKGSLGLGESYMKGLWDCQALDQFIYKILSADLENYVSRDLKSLWYKIQAALLNNHYIKKSYNDIKKHYDLGNDLFELMLDKRMIYSCAYWQNAKTLEEAQENKLDLICRKLNLEKGQRVLDIGCGWGGFASYAAEKYGVEVVGITISEEQVTLAKQRCENLPVEIRFQDYRSLDEKFDRVVSIGMFEHVGYKNYGTYMSVVKRVLKDDGLFLLHCIGSNTSVTTTDPWINTYIFPNGMMPSIKQISKAAENKLIMEDWHNFGPFYDLTLMEWLKRFKSSWSELDNKYNEQFYRMWEYYLSCSAASFRAKKNNLWQIVFSVPTRHATYISVR